MSKFLAKVSLFPKYFPRKTPIITPVSYTHLDVYKRQDLYIGKRETLGLGVGFDFKSFYIDATYSKVKINSTNVYGDGDYYATDNNGNVIFFTNNPNTFTSNLEDVRDNIYLTVGWKF